MLNGHEAFGPAEPHPMVLRVLEDVMVKHTVGDLGRGAAKGWAIGQL